MLNFKIAKIFEEMAEFYVMKDDIFRPKAYERAARLAESMGEDLEDIYKKGGTMRLGDYECRIQKGTKSFAAYGAESVLERHRHRYEPVVHRASETPRC